MEENKTSIALLSVLCYVDIGWLAVLIYVLVSKSTDSFLRYNLNQGILWYIVIWVASIILGLLSFNILLYILNVIRVAVIIIALVNCLGFKKFKIPVIGDIKIV